MSVESQVVGLDLKLALALDIEFECLKQDQYQTTFIIVRQCSVKMIFTNPIAPLSPCPCLELHPAGELNCVGKDGGSRTSIFSSKDLEKSSSCSRTGHNSKDPRQPRHDLLIAE
jgi:hypothetical protein